MVEGARWPLMAFLSRRPLIDLVFLSTGCLATLLTCPFERAGEGAGVVADNPTPKWVALGYRVPEADCSLT